MSFTSFGQSIPVTGLNVGFPGTVSREGDRVIVARQVNTAAAKTLSFGEAAVLVSDSTGGTWRSVADYIAAAAANVANVAAQFAGIAVREVKTMLTFPGTVTPGTLQTGYYGAGEMAEVLERGNMSVVVANGTPAAGNPVYVRIVANSSTAGTVVGDLEAAAETVSTTGTAASGTTLAVASPTGIVANQLVTGAGIAAGTYVVSISNSNVTLSAAVTAALSGTAVVFSNTVVLPDVVFRTGVQDANGVAEITLKARKQA